MTNPASTLESILRRRALLILGKGGVGRTSTTAALAMSAAQAGRGVLVMECDSHAPLAALFGCRPSFAPIDVAPNLRAMVLDGARALEEYLRLSVTGSIMLGAVFSSRLYKYFVDAAPGLRALMMLGKVCYEIDAKRAGNRPRDLIILDAPASGQALSLLRMPIAANDTFGQSLVGREARHIAATLSDSARCGIIYVTIPEPLATAETLETHAALAQLGYLLGAIVLNRFVDAPFNARDVSRLVHSPAFSADRRRAAALAKLARNQLRRASASRRALADIPDRAHTRAIVLPDHPELSGLDLIRRLTADLASPLRPAVTSTG